MEKIDPTVEKFYNREFQEGRSSTSTSTTKMSWKTSTTLEDESGISFHDTVWTSKFGLPMPPDVLTYFSMSSFYDRTCNNELIKMQQLSMDKMRSVEEGMICWK